MGLPPRYPHRQGGTIVSHTACQLIRWSPSYTCVHAMASVMLPTQPFNLPGSINEYRQYAGGKGVRNYLCRVAGNTVWSHMTSDFTSALWGLLTYMRYTNRHILYFTLLYTVDRVGRISDKVDVQLILSLRLVTELSRSILSPVCTQLNMFNVFDVWLAKQNYFSKCVAYNSLVCHWLDVHAASWRSGCGRWKK